MIVFLPVNVFSFNDLSFETMYVDSIEIDNRNIYDLSLKEFDNFLFKTANKLHYRTKKSVIIRELLLKKGDLFSYELADESTRNLRLSLAIFDARYEVVQISSTSVLLRIITIDKWSLTGGLDVNRIGNETNYKLNFKEKNFLGNNQFLNFEYFIRETEENYSAFTFQDKRIFGAPFRTTFQYSNNPIGSFRRFSLGRPFYNLAQKNSFFTSLDFFSGRIDGYDDNIRVSESFYDGENVSIGFSHRIGSYYKKIEINPRYRYVNKQILGSNFVSESNNVELPLDSNYHETGVGIEIYQIEYDRTERIDGFGFVEDITKGKSFGIHYAKVFDSRFDNNIYDFISIQSALTTAKNNSFFSITISNLLWLKDSDTDRSIVNVTSTFYNNKSKNFTLALKSRFLYDWRKSGIGSLILGGNSGLRGYDKFYKTGNRIAVINIEGRFFTGLKFLTAEIGTVLFADIGKSWNSGEDLNIDNFEHSVGAGLRFYLDKFSSSNAFRLDFSYNRVNNWEISIGAGQYFQSNLSRLLLTN